jgi:hypothetical protein
MISGLSGVSMIAGLFFGVGVLSKLGDGYRSRVCRRGAVKVSWVGLCVRTAPVIGKRKLRRRGREKHRPASSLSPQSPAHWDSSPCLARLHFSEHIHLVPRPRPQLMLSESRRKTWQCEVC